MGGLAVIVIVGMAFMAGLAADGDISWDTWILTAGAIIVLGIVFGG